VVLKTKRWSEVVFAELRSDVRSDRGGDRGAVLSLIKTDKLFLTDSCTAGAIRQADLQNDRRLPGKLGRAVAYEPQTDWKQGCRCYLYGLLPFAARRTYLAQASTSSRSGGERKPCPVCISVCFAVQKGIISASCGRGRWFIAPGASSGSIITPTHGPGEWHTSGLVRSRCADWRGRHGRGVSSARH
jgi:hypothetical protein